MAEEILMPRLSDTMTEGVIASWHKKVGDPVKKGDVLAEIETDKATMELESYKDGTLLHIGAGDGGKLQVNDLLAVIGNPGEDVSGIVAKHSGGNQPAPASAQPPQEKKEEAAPAPAPQPAPAANQAPAKDYSKMEEVVLMPRLSDTMTEGVIASWQKNVGDDVKKGDILAEIETDKATMELESYKDGKLLYQGAKQGEKIQVNDLLAIIGKEGLNVQEIVNGIKGGTPAAGAEIDPQRAGAFDSSPKTEADTRKGEGDVAPANAQVQNQPAPALQETGTQQPASGSNGRIFASPLAKKMAQEKGIDLKSVKGSGDNGRIIKSDIENYQPQAQPAAQSQPAAAQPATTDFEEIPVSQMRKTIARRLAESKFTAPHFYLTMTIDMDAAITARTRINELSKIKISFNDIVLKAVAVALTQHPKVNSSWMGDKIRINHHVNIGVAVAVEEGLLVPVVRNADAKPLSQISKEVKDFAQRAKDKKLQPADWEGSTFTISNLGMFGIDEFTAIINPPDSCILAIGGISQVPVVKNGAVVPGNVMKVTLSCDHRVVDGATGAAFLQTVKSLLEEPLRMLV
ncbi:pyruvate dehydrogenase complex dihydrolipoamide acetyltransferase [Ilyomonas limi]|uniref:Acetyltransferase component of pyruvate dehydrogenase complex n=1 Tax=Ilyomonas limi TaxID=2575867 RepID=A0A4U3LB09_9BACT|nr:pyruvate dehydrogenase complex dihydrolipoamide acetyltransferase [Ilyomonas limi]TKK71919.1 pyruvate dehydrogenase complex dihydrolipoamide acetyltransferase [Ilyomonas limi]